MYLLLVVFGFANITKDLAKIRQKNVIVYFSLTSQKAKYKLRTTKSGGLRTEDRLMRKSLNGCHINL